MASDAAVAEFLAAKRALDAANGSASRGSSSPAVVAAAAAAWRRLCAAAPAAGVDAEGVYLLHTRAREELARLLGGGPAAAAAAAPDLAGGARLLALLARVAAAEPADWRARYWRDAGRPAGSVRVFAVSDLHVDQGGGRYLRWCAETVGGSGGGGASAFKNDVLIVAGDCGDSLAAARAALAALRPKFARVALCPGNHDLWLPHPPPPGGGGGNGNGSGNGNGNGGGDSFARLFELRRLCAALDVDTAPFVAARGLVVAPLLSWYDAAFDEADPRPGRLRFDARCAWPCSDLDVWQAMLRLNAPFLRPPRGSGHATHAAAALAGAPAAAAGGGASSSAAAVPPPPPAAAAAAAVVSASHFLPHRALPSSPHVGELRKAVGCAALAAQLAAVGAGACPNGGDSGDSGGGGGGNSGGGHCHVFGHTHINGAWELDDEDDGGDGGGSGSGGSTAAAAAAGSPPGQRRRRRRRLYVQHALEAAAAAGAPRGASATAPTLARVFDGARVGYALVDAATGAALAAEGQEAARQRRW